MVSDPLFYEITDITLPTASSENSDSLSGVIDCLSANASSNSDYSLTSTTTHKVRPAPDHDIIYAWMAQPIIQPDPAAKLPSPPTFGPPEKMDPLDVSPSYNEAQVIFENLIRLLEPGQVVELRAIGVTTDSFRVPHIVSGYFEYDHLQDMAVAASELSSDSKGVYYILNRINPDLLARRKNRVDVVHKDETTKDDEVLRRRWLLIDLDPVRPSGISSTDEEKNKAWIKINAVREFLRERWWPEAVLCDSGNGYHLLYRIDLPVNDDDLVKRVLHALAAMFDDDDVTVDKKVFNPSRITKVYGTQARKGDPDLLRPHRWSGIIEFPNQLIPVPKEQLEAFVDAVLPKANANTAVETAKSPQVAAASVKGVKSVVERAQAYLTKVPPAQSGNGGHTATFHAASVLVKGFALSPSAAMPLLKVWNETCSPPWTDGELEHKLDDASKVPGPKGYLLGHSANDEPSAGSGFEDSIIDSRQLEEANVKNEFLVRQVLVANQLCVLGGPKKTLKTSIAIDLALSIATGQPFLNTFAVPKPGKVLLCSAESGLATLRDTAQRVCLAKGIKLRSCDIMWADRVPRLSNLSDLEALSRLIQQRNVVAVVIDPVYLALLSPESKLNPGNIYDMGPLVLRVAQACVPFGATPILVHHTKTRPRVNRLRDDEPLGLEDLTYSGIGEGCRQWMILSRQNEYDQERGIHSLWLNSGGSAGHGAIYSLEVKEGVVNSQLGGRTWKVTVRSQAKAIEEKLKQKNQKKEDAKACKLAEDKAAILKALANDKTGKTPPEIEAATGIPVKRVRQVLWELTKSLTVIRMKVPKSFGTSAKGQQGWVSYQAYSSGTLKFDFDEQAALRAGKFVEEVLADREQAAGGTAQHNQPKASKTSSKNSATKKKKEKTGADG